MNTPRYSKEQYVLHLKQLKAKAGLHSAVTAAAVLCSLDQMIANVESDGYDDKAKAYGELVKRAHAGDAVATAEVTKLRQTRINNYLVARSNWLIFFNMVTLGAAEVPEYIHESRQEARIAVSVGADGGWRKSHIVKYKEHLQIQLFQIASELYTYPLWDPLRGNVADEIKALIDVAGDLEEKINQKAKPFVTGACVSAFTTTGSKAGRTFVTHSSVASGNIPTTNRLDASAAGRFSKAAMDMILGYCAAWGTLYGEVLKPEVVLLPSLDATGQLADVTMTSQQNDITSQIFGGGQVLDYGGAHWNIVPDITLEPTEGFAYVKLNRPIGDFFHKPDGDKVYDNPAKEGPLGNTGEMGMSKWIGFAAPLPWNPFVLRVKYK